MTKPSLQDNEELPSNRSFGIVFTLCFLIISILPTLHEGSLNKITMLIAALIAAITAFRQSWLSPLNKQWTKFGSILHKVINPVILGALYVLAILPIGILYKALKKDPLKISKTNSTPSYWIERQSPEHSRKSMQRQF